MRKEKQFLLDEIKEKIDDSQGFIITSYKGLTAGKAREFRDVITENGGEFEVVKKRVLVKAAGINSIQFDVKQFQGHVGVIFVNGDTTQVAKSAVKYGEDNGGILEVLGGHLDGSLITGEDIVAIAKLPSIEELRAQIVGLLQAPLAQTVGVINAVLTSPLHCLEEKTKKE
ncbi:MAG: 50S ribosomal protein L10 [Chlamydiales bacterium]